MSQESPTSESDLNLDEIEIAKNVEFYRLKLTLQASKIIAKFLNKEGEEASHSALLSNTEKEQINIALKILEIAYKSS